MTDIARLSVALYANSAQFVSELQKSQKKADSWGKHVSGAFSVAAKATAAGATAAAGAIALIYTQQAQLIDQTTKLSQSLGMTTESYTQLRYAANLNGAGEVFDSAMESMVVKMGEATFGSGEAKEALDILGLSAAKLGEMTPDQQLLALSDALKNVENQSQKTFITDSIFGGPEMMNLLNQGSESINAMAQEADLLGITLNRIDAAKIEMANDAMYKVGQTTNALNQSLSTQLAPFVAELADQFIEYSKQFGGMNNMIAEGIHTTTQGVGFMADAFHGVQLILKSIEVAWYGVVHGIQSSIQGLVNILHEMGNEILKAVTWPILQALDAMSGMSDAAANMAAEIRATLEQQPIQIFDGVDINNAKLDLNNAIWELQSLASEPLPSTGIEAWYQQTKTKFDELAKQYANQVKPLTSGGGTQLSLPETGGGKGKGDSKKDKQDPAVAAFKQATDQIQLEWQRRLLLQQAGDEATAMQEQFAYEDRTIRLSEQFQAAYEAAANNQALQQELENQYFESRSALWNEHQANLTDIETNAAAARRQALASELGNYSNVFGQMAGIAKTFAGKQSGIYKAMFAASKAFAIAESIIKIQQGIANAAS
ncbi:hypothetical protein, partial [Photobacterium leiognathi]|uniref:hypothetical protein n=1 Tax=Photobacterium leiognathi TaxID=553611 RepID=UPI000D4069CF